MNKKIFSLFIAKTKSFSLLHNSIVQQRLWRKYSFQGVGGMTSIPCRVYSRNWPMRVKSAPFCNFCEPFFKKGVQERWPPKRYLNLWVQTVPWENEPLLTLCRHFGTFWATEKAWARITAESRMFVWWNNDSNEKRKAIETVRGYKSSE